MPLPFTEEGRARQALLSSKEYLEADPEGRKEMLGIFKSASPTDRKRFIFGEGETPGLTHAPERAAKEGLSMLGGMVKKSLTSAPKEIGEGTSSGMIDMGGAAVGAITGGYLGSKTGIPGAGKLGATLGEASGAYLANQGNKMLGMREGQAFGTPDTGDYLSAGVPLGMRTVAGASKLATKPAQTRLKDVDEGSREIGKQFKLDVEDLKRRTDLTNQERSTRASELAQAYNQRLKAHSQAAQETYPNATAGMDIPDPKPAYKASEAAAQLAPPMDVRPFSQTAKQAGIDLDSPVEAYSPMSRVTSALKEWAGGKPVPIDEVLDVHQELGWAVGKTKGKQHKVASEMYGTLDDMVKQHRTASPDAATAIDKHFEGQAAWKRQKSFQEIEELIDTNVSNPAPGEFQVKTRQIRDGFNELKENPHFRSSVTNREIAQVQREVDKLPTAPVGRKPPPARLKQLDTTEPEIKRDRALTGLQEGLKEPQPFPIAKTILGKVIGSTIGGAGAQYLGLPTYHGITAGAIAGGGAVAVPHWVSNTLMKSDKGQQIVRNIMAGKQTLTPERLAALTSVARRLGGSPEDDDQ